MSLDSNWIAQAKQKIACGAELTAAETKTLIFALSVETLLAGCADILDAESSSESNITVSSYYDKIQCGYILSETELTLLTALLELKNKECAARKNDDTVDEDEDCRIIASGIWTYDGTTEIAIEGLLETDVVQATIHTQEDDETILSAKCEADKITIVLSGTPYEDMTMVNYTVIRCFSEY